nr:BMP family ABC transporter substrate-binding protein [Halanaeroarchaeum sulfurireducens]
MPEATGSGAEEDGETDVRAAFVYHDVVGDFGWQWAHDQARRRVEREFDWLETRIFDNLQPKNSQPEFRQYAERGFDVIFGTSYGYMDPMYDVAPEYPNVAFEQCSGYKQRENMGRYFGRMYQPRYLAGVAAGLLTEEGTLGYVAAFPNSEVVRGINAFALGASSVNDDVTVRVRYTDTWNDTETERRTAKQLIDTGVDVMGQHQNFPAAAETAAEAGIWAIGYNSPMGDYVGENYVTSPIWHWDVFYRQAVQDVRNGTWKADSYWKGLNAGIVDLSDWGPKVPDEVIATVEQKRTQIETGELDVWADTRFGSFDDEELFMGVESYVDSVAGSVPE